MNVYEDDNIRNRLIQSFPRGFVNGNFEFIAHPKRNSYFSLKGVCTLEELSAKVIEWLSREAIKGGNRSSMQYHLNGINEFLGTRFSKEEMETIYTYLGNRVNHEKTLRFIKSGFNLATLEEMQ